MKLYLGIVGTALALANSFTEPDATTEVHKDKNLYIAWSELQGEKIDLSLMNGDPANLQLIEVIGSEMPNIGSAEWYVPQDLPDGEYTLRIGSTDGDAVNYSHFFKVHPSQEAETDSASSTSGSDDNSAKSPSEVGSGISKSSKKKVHRKNKFKNSKH